ncbi:hypothetical protein AAC387_Pa03g2234 [Persea americana]
MEEEIKGEGGCCRKSAEEVRKFGDAVVVDVDDLWVKSMETKLASKHCPPSHPFTICRVPTGIRRVDNDAYGPLIVSIGPYHRGSPSLLEMEEVKWSNLKKVSRRAGNDFNEYLKAMKEIEPRARGCYSGNIDMGANEFIEMMLLDGLFIIQFLTDFLLFQRIDKKDEDREPIYTIRGMLCRVCHDMLLLENQLPFFVLECLWKLTGHTWRFALWKCARDFICIHALPLEHEWRSPGRLRKIFDEVDGVYHLLHLVYLLLKPTCLTGTRSESMELEPNTGSTSESMEPTSKPPAFIKKMRTLSCLPPRCRDLFRSPSGQESQSMECNAKLKLPAVIKKMKICGLPFLSSRKSRNKPLEKAWPKWRAKLLHDYFGSPWSIISFLAATIVVILTIVQTCYAVFT